MQKEKLLELDNSKFNIFFESFLCLLSQILYSNNNNIELEDAHFISKICENLIYFYDYKLANNIKILILEIFANLLKKSSDELKDIIFNEYNYLIQNIQYYPKYSIIFSKGEYLYGLYIASNIFDILGRTNNYIANLLISSGVIELIFLCIANNKPCWGLEILSSILS
jgi:hypothetical protein